MRGVGAVLLGLGVALAGVATAGADPIDHTVPPNGQWPPGERAPLITPDVSPIQVPAPEVGATETIAYPYLAPWVHDAVPVPPDHGLEVRGAVRANLPDRLVVLNGHCLFGSDAGAAESTVVHVDAGPVTIDLQPAVR